MAFALLPLMAPEMVPDVEDVVGVEDLFPEEEWRSWTTSPY
jgi:hypothetical protein